MPWINKEMCIGCEVCVNECSVGAISMDDGIAFINDSKCIRCGICHDVCTTDAVRHDGERIPEEVASNLAWAKELLENDYYSNDKKKQKELIERLKRYFTKNKKVMAKTIESLEILRNTNFPD